MQERRTPLTSPFLLTLAAAAGFTACTEPSHDAPYEAEESNPQEIVAALERDRDSFTADRRLEFVGAMKLRLDRLSRLLEVAAGSATSGAPSADELDAAEELEGEIAEQLLALELDPPSAEEEWKEVRERLLQRTRTLQDEVVGWVEAGS